MVAEDSFPKTVKMNVPQCSAALDIEWKDGAITKIEYSVTDSSIMESFENIVGILFETSDKYEVYMNDKPEDDKDNG